MNLKFLSSIFLLIAINIQLLNCMGQIDSKVKKAKKICDAAYLKAVAFPDLNSLLLTSTLSGSSSSGSTVSTDTTIALAYSTSSTTSFTSPKFITQLNKKGNTLTGTISSANDTHVWAFKGLSQIDTWQIKFNSDSTALCKAGVIYSTTSATTVNDSGLNVSITSSSNSLAASNLASTYIVCTSPSNTKLTSPTGLFSTGIDYSINLFQDEATTAQANSALASVNPLQQVQAAQKQLKETTALLNWSNCYSDADRVNDIKSLLLF